MYIYIYVCVCIYIYIYISFNNFIQLDSLVSLTGITKIYIQVNSLTCLSSPTKRSGSKFFFFNSYRLYQTVNNDYCETVNNDYCETVNNDYCDVKITKVKKVKIICFIHVFCMPNNLRASFRLAHQYCGIVEPAQKNYT